MSKRDKYAPDYSKLYPGVEISPEVRRVLTGSDRKMKYCEFDLKTEQVRKCPKSGKAKVYPAREDSLDRLIDDNDEQYASQEPTPEEIVADQDELFRLRSALNQLTPKEWMLVNALYYRNMSEAEAGKFLGITQQAVSYRIKSICRKLKKIMRI